MNTALLSARKRTIAGELRAEKELCGRSVLSWQVDLARSAGCERIICLCDAPTPEIIELQRGIEASGGEFHAIKSSLQLVSLLRTDETLVMILDGLVADAKVARRLMVEGGKLSKAVFTIEAGSDLTEAYPADFERIDATRCWAGIAVFRAAVAQKLADLPPDGEVSSLLLRLALQSQTETIPIDFDEMAETDWVLAKDHGQLALREDAMLDDAMPRNRWSGPIAAIAGKVVRLGGAKWIAQGPLVPSILAVVAAAIAALLVSYHYVVTGLALATFGALLAAFTRIVSHACLALDGAKKQSLISRNISAITDILAVMSLCIAFISQPAAIIALPILTMGLLRLAERNSAPGVAPFWNDRALHLAGLTVCAAYGILSEGLAVLGLLALAQALVGKSLTNPFAGK